MSEDKTEEYWCMIGDRVMTHFLYHSMLSLKEFNDICFEAVKEVDKKGIKREKNNV